VPCVKGPVSKERLCYYETTVSGFKAKHPHRLDIPYMIFLSFLLISAGFCKIQLLYIQEASDTVTHTWAVKHNSTYNLF
jgi:hypothetical protein